MTLDIISYIMANLKAYICALLTTIIFYKFLLTTALMNEVLKENIPFAVNPETSNEKNNKEIHILSRIEKSRSFFHIFNIPHIICFFAAKGKWPFVPAMMQPRLEEEAKTFFNNNDSYIKQVCQKWIKIKECFRPLFSTSSSEVEALPARSTVCTCANYASPDQNPVLYLDKKYLNNLDTDTIESTIEFLENLLPTATKKTKKKIIIRGRVDDFDID